MKTETTRTSFAKRLRDLLGDRRGSWLSSVSGLSPPRISRLLSGAKPSSRSEPRPPSYTSITALASAFEITADELVRGTDAVNKAADPFVARAMFERVTQQLRARLIQEHRNASKVLRTSLLNIARTL